MHKPGCSTLWNLKPWSGSVFNMENNWFIFKSSTHYFCSRWINQTYKQLQTRWTSTRETILFFYLQTESANVSSRDENVKDPLKVLCIWYACEAYCGILFSEKLLEKHNHVFMYHECQTCLFWFNAQKSWKITWKTEKLKFFAQQPKLLIDNLIWALTTNILEARKSFLPNKSTSNFFLYQVRNLW